MTCMRWSVSSDKFSMVKDCLLPGSLMFSVFHPVAPASQKSNYVQLQTFSPTVLPLPAWFAGYANRSPKPAQNNTKKFHIKRIQTGTRQTPAHTDRRFGFGTTVHHCFGLFRSVKRPPSRWSPCRHRSPDRPHSTPMAWVKVSGLCRSLSISEGMIVAVQVR